MFLCRSVLVAAVLTLSAAAQAQPISGLYFGGATGANFANTTLSESGNTKVATDPGPLGVLALGWGLGNGVRVELEGAYRNNAVSTLDTRRLSGSLMPTGNVGGNVASYATMVNAFYDFDLRSFGTAIRPYIGVGAGVGWLQYEQVSGNEPVRFRLPGSITAVDAARTSLNGTGSAFAYQAIAGAAYPLRAIPGLEATAEFRYFAVQDVKIAGGSVGCCGNVINGVVPAAHSYGRFGSSDESLLIGLRYMFGMK